MDKRDTCRKLLIQVRVSTGLLENEYYEKYQYKILTEGIYDNSNNFTIVGPLPIFQIVCLGNALSFNSQ